MLNDYACKLKNVNLAFGSNKILSSCNFGFNRNEFVIVTGENGVGKSTLLRVCAYLQTPNNGSVDWKDGFDSWAVGFYSQDLMLYRDLTVKQNLEFFWSMCDSPQFSVKDYINRFSLQRFEKTRIKSLSSGYQARVSFCRSIITAEDISVSGSVLFLDEPSNSLDNKGVELLCEELQNFMNRKDSSVILVTHLKDKFEKFSSRIWSF